MLLRRLVGYALFCAGGASVVYAGSRYAIGAWTQHDARRSWTESEARTVVALARRTIARDRGTALPTALPIALGAPIGRLLIPRLRLDEIVLEGVDDNTLNGGPGHLPGSAYPGERGNAVISAHRDRHFARLGAVQVGDTVVTESGADRQTWVVISRRVIDADAPALFRTTDETLTLTTCWPIRHFGTAPERLLLTAKPVKQPASQSPSFAAASAS